MSIITGDSRRQGLGFIFFGKKTVYQQKKLITIRSIRDLTMMVNLV